MNNCTVGILGLSAVCSGKIWTALSWPDKTSVGPTCLAATDQPDLQTKLATFSHLMYNENEMM